MSINLNLTNLTTLQNDTSAVEVINSNNAAIADAFTDVLALDGSMPNQMLANLDMNSNQVLNLPAPATVNSPARLIDVMSNPTITVPPVGTSGATVPLLNANNTFSGNTTFTGTVTISGGGTATQNGNNVFTGNNTYSGTNTYSDGITVSAGTVSLPANALPNASLATVPNNTVKGNVAGSTTSPTDINQTQLTTLINPFTSSLSGAVPASGGGTTQFLRADSTFAVPSTSATVLLNTLTASNSATLQDIVSMTSTYSSYKLIFQNIIPATNENFVYLAIYSGGAFKYTSYITSILINGAATTSWTTSIPMTYTTISNAASISNAGPGLSGEFTIYTPSTSGLIMCNGNMSYGTGGGACSISEFSGYWNSAGVVSGFQVACQTGNITSGVIKIYGTV